MVNDTPLPNSSDSTADGQRPDGFPEGDRIGPYRLEKRVGAGGMGEVYRALDTRLERPVALKRIRIDGSRGSRVRRRFQREARVAAGLSHPRIARVYDVLSTAQDDWIVMEWIDGRPLSVEPDLRRAVELAVDIASALQAAHREGVVHRDLKAGNVLVDREGRTKLLDFGLAKRPSGDKPSSLTLEGQVVGTPHAMSPEQAMGRTVDARTDLFSFGSLLYELLTGVAPFRDTTSLETLHQVCSYTPPPLHETVSLPTRLSDLVDRLLEKDPARRPSSAAQVLAELRRVLAEPMEVPAEDSASPADEVAQESTLLRGSAPGTTRNGGTETDPSTSSGRRLVTVLCLRLAPRRSGGAALDLEALRGLPYREMEDLARDVVERYGGHLEHVSEHETVACFGYPQIHEDDADRAVLTALELRRRMPGLVLETVDLGLRIAIGSGPAVVLGEDTGLLQLALGSTLDHVQDRAQRAASGELLLGSETYRLLRRPFDTEPADGEARQGSGVHRVTGLAESSTGLTVPNDHDLLGRDREIELLIDRWNRADAGQGQAVVIRGEAGIGKSSLVTELRRRLEAEDTDWWVLQGSAWAAHSPFQPLREPLRRFFKLDAETEDPLDCLASSLRSLGPEGATVDEKTAVPLLASLLDLAWEEQYPPLGWTAKKIRQETFDVLVGLLMGAAAARSTVLFVEDLHWMDSTTLEWLGRLIGRVGESTLFIVATARPQFQNPWSAAETLTELHLERLKNDDVALLIDREARDQSLAEDVRRYIAEKAAGVPLFAEELTRSILESGELEDQDGVLQLRGNLDDLSLPATLESSITARLDRLGSAKTVAQLASVIGREVSPRLLEALSDLSAAELEVALGRLMSAGLMQRKGFSRQRRYLFRHALVQDAAYDSLLAVQKRRLHQRLAERLEEELEHYAETQPELLAHHYTRAEVFDRAVDYWQRAGQEMVSRSAVVEAVAHLEKGISLIPSLREGEARDRIELTLQSSLGSALATKKGFSAVETTEAYQRAYELGVSLGDSSGTFWTLRGLCHSYITSARHRENLSLCHKLTELGMEQADPSCSIAAYLSLAAELFQMGRLRAALEAVEAGIELDQQDRTFHFANRLAMDPGVNLLSLSSRILWFLGRSAEAFHRVDSAIQFAEQVSHSGSLAHAKHCQVALYYDLRYPAHTLAVAHEVVANSRQQGSFYEHWTKPYMSWAQAMISDGAPSRKLQELRNMLTAAVRHKESIGFLCGRPLYMSMLAQIWMLEGESERALDCTRDALDFIQDTGEELYKAEILCLQGQILSTHAETIERAGPSFEQAIAFAVERGHVPLESRARRALRVFDRNRSAGRSRVDYSTFGCLDFGDEPPLCKESTTPAPTP